MLNLGRYVVAIIQLTHPHQPDDPLEDQTTLDHLMFPFAATRGAAGDRRFSWNSPIAISHAALPDRPLTVEYDQSQTVLEVGLVEPSTTLWHLRNSGGLARWPLGHGALTLILATDGCTRPNTAPPTVADVYG